MLRKMRLFLWAQVTEGVKDMVWDDWLRSEIIGQVTEGVSGYRIEWWTAWAGPSGEIWIVFYTELKALNCSPLLTPISSFWAKGLHLVDLLNVTFLLLTSDGINLAEKKRHGLGWLAKIWNKLHTIIEATFRTKNIIFYDWLRSEIRYEVMIHKSSLQWLWEQNELIRYKATSYIFMSLIKFQSFKASDSFNPVLPGPWSCWVSCWTIELFQKAVFTTRSHV